MSSARTARASRPKSTTRGGDRGRWRLRERAERRFSSASSRDRDRALVEHVREVDDASRRSHDARVGVYARERVLHLLEVGVGDEVRLVEDEGVREGDLQRRLFVLAELSVDVGGVDERDDGVEDGAVVVEEFVVDPEFLRDGTGIGEAGGLEEDEVELAPGRRAALEQVVDGLDEAAFDGAAHAAVVHLHPSSTAASPSGLSCTSIFSTPSSAPNSFRMTATR